MFKIPLIILALAGIASSATITVSSGGVQPTQAVLAWTHSGTCTVEVSESNTYSPLVHDVDSTLFTSSDLSNRAEALTSGDSHVFVVGKRGVYTGSDTKNYSRALQNATTHYYRVTCGADVGTGTFTTAAIQFGATWADELQIAPSGSLIYPTVLPNNRTQSLIDSKTGILFHPLNIADDVNSLTNPYILSSSSAGFDIFCSGILHSGHYHCLIPALPPYDYGPSLYAITPGTGETIFLGTMWFFGQSYGFDSGVSLCTKPMWDEVSSLRLYCGMHDQTNTSELSLAMIDLNGADTPITTGHQGSDPPPGNFTVTNLTPYPNTLGSKIAAFAPTLTFPCEVKNYQVGTVAITCLSFGAQDTYAWIGAYDLGNKQPLGSGGTGAIQSLIPMYAQSACRWCVDHTNETLGPTVPMLSFATQTAKATNPADGAGTNPSRVILKTTLTAVTPGTEEDIVVLSAWDMSWGTQPAGYTACDPLSEDSLHFIMAAAVGDFLRFPVGSLEDMKIVAKADNCHWTVKRGVNGITTTHAINDYVWMYCNAGTEVEPDTFPYMWWKFIASPTANANFGANFGDHPISRGNYHANSYPFRVGDITDPATWGLFSTVTGQVEISPDFAGQNGTCNGETCQAHINMPESAPAWGIDQRPFLGGNLFTQGTAATNITGSLWQYSYNGSGVTGLHRKQLTTLALNGDNPLKDISGPSVTLPTNSSGNFQYCVANVANECRSGSSIGDIFFNVPTLDLTYCTDAHPSATADLDVCIGNQATIAFTVPQVKWVADTTGQSVRVLGRMFAIPHGAGTANVKTLYDGSWGLFLGQSPADRIFFIMKIPSIPMSDSVARNTFVRAQLNLTAPANVGVSTAKVYFGYTEQGTVGSSGQYYCTTRREACIAVSALVTDATPFSFVTTDSYSPASCSTSCTITIPVLPLHTAYFKVSYLDSMGAEVATKYGVASESTVTYLGDAPAPPSFSGVGIGGPRRSAGPRTRK